MRYQRTQGRIEQLKTVWGKVKDDKLFPLFNQVRAEHGCLSWADPTLFDLDPALCREVVLDKAVRERTANREAALDILEEVTGDPMLKQDREREVWPFLDGGPPIGDVDLTGC